MENFPTDPSEDPSEQKPTFDATLSMERKEWNTLSIVSSLVRFPFLTFKTVALIYVHAAILWLKRTPVFEHPLKRGEIHPRGPSAAVHSSPYPGDPR